MTIILDGADISQLYYLRSEKKNELECSKYNELVDKIANDLRHDLYELYSRILSTLKNLLSNEGIEINDTDEIDPENYFTIQTFTDIEGRDYITIEYPDLYLGMIIVGLIEQNSDFNPIKRLDFVDEIISDLDKWTDDNPFMEKIEEIITNAVDEFDAAYSEEEDYETGI